MENENENETEIPEESDVRLGFFSGPGVHEKPVRYTVVDGLAIMEGDIELGPAQEVEAEAERIRARRSHSDDGDGLTGARAEHDERPLEGVGMKPTSVFLWRNGVMPYEIDPALPDPQRVVEAIEHWRKNTAIRFVARTARNQAKYPNFVRFVQHANPGVGSSQLGRRGGMQKIRLGNSVGLGTTIHEIGHALGLYHEQSRGDRDEHVKINWANISPGREHNFQQALNASDYYEYDYGSIMHYSAKAFSKNGKPTIEPLQSGVKIGQRKGLSFGDRLAVARMYRRFFSAGYTGVWRKASGPQALWVRSSWSSFVSRWSAWSKRGLRLVDLDVQRSPAGVRYSGVFRPGTGKYALVADVEWATFKAKWQELSAQGLRLIDLDVGRQGSKTRYSGAWVAGGGAHALWVNASWASFKAKWQENTSKNLRLVDLHVLRINGQTRYSGVWRAGVGAHALWVNASWASFRAKWKEYGSRGLRLVDVSTHRIGGELRYSGVWRPGTDGYALWADATWESFRAKNEQLVGQGFRLVDFDVAPPSGALADSFDAVGEGSVDAGAGVIHGMTDEDLHPSEPDGSSEGVLIDEGHGDGAGVGLCDMDSTGVMLDTDPLGRLDEVADGGFFPDASDLELIAAQ